MKIELIAVENGYLLDAVTRLCMPVKYYICTAKTVNASIPFYTIRAQVNNYKEWVQNANLPEHGRINIKY